ncbi:GntR family transcriptional regulator [Xanthobacter sp. KR7-225]|uniref:GntR family transcriptional regulator n=1 Tax=Xanthobacter sp. KR7-225 TaxID=3156613 RepID=UPI0032B4AF26
MDAPLDTAAGSAATAADATELKKRLRTSAVPLYVALSNLLRAEIEAGRWAVGAQLPTLERLSELYGVARVTARQALGVLADDGLIERVQGKGTFVASGAPERKIIQLDSDWHNFLKMLDGNLPEPLVVDPDCAPPRLAPNEGAPAQRYRYMRRVHRASAQPYCVIDVYLAQHVYRLAPQAFDSQMVIPLLGQVCGPKLQKMAQSFRIMAADLTVARWLDLPVGAPVGEVRRVITDQDGVVLYLGIGQYRGDLVVFNTTLEVPRE